MKYSKLFGKTTKSVKKDMQFASHRLLYQAGFVRESSAGRYFFLPLAMRVKAKIIEIIRAEMNKAGAQEMLAPTLHPLELWEETNRDQQAGFELMQLQDRRGAKFALGGTAEEMFVDVVRKFQLSYKDLPFNIYQFSEKFRDEFRARGGLLRVREFTMKDAYSFDIDANAFEKTYQAMAKAYENIIKKIGLNPIKVSADGGYIGGDYCHEYVVECDVGESKFLTTADGSYCAHEDIATFDKEAMIQNKDKTTQGINTKSQNKYVTIQGQDTQTSTQKSKQNTDLSTKPQPLEKINIIRKTTMMDGAKAHQRPLHQQLKNVLYKNDQGIFVLAVIRGDLDVNETKLKNLSQSNQLQLASDQEIIDRLGSVPGFISPVQIRDCFLDSLELMIVADDSVRNMQNSYSGANQLNFDYININIDRDFKPDLEGDIALAKAGYLTTKGQKLIEKKGSEVGNIFQLGLHYSKKMHNATFTNQQGKQTPFYMGCYGFGIGRAIATIVEIHHDQKGIIWPKSVAPFDVHLINLAKTYQRAENFYHKLRDLGIEVLWDERECGAGEKFADADLIGIPYRVVISEKMPENIVEIKKRTEQQHQLLKIDEALSLLIKQK